MKKKTTSSFSSVVSVNPYTKEYYTSVSNILTKADKVEYLKEQYAISFLNNKNFIHSQISISKNIPQEDVYDAIYNKAYDELALDQAVEYNIEILESFSNLDEENRFYHIFIVDPAETEETFKEVIKEIKYIDRIIPISLLFKTLYTKEIIDSNGVDCFVYIQENDTFLTIYKEKEFLYTKSLRFSLFDMYERFCEIFGERIDYNDFKEFISSENLKYSTSEYLEAFIKLYKEFFHNINEVLTYAKRAYELDNIDKIYIGSSVYFESKLDEILETELAIKSEVLEFDYGFDTNDVYVDQIHQLMHLYTTVNNEEKYLVNFTLYKRPPKFLQRESGKLLAVIAASFILAFLYPVTYWILTYMQSFELNYLKEQYSEIHNLKVTREATIKTKKADLEKISVLVREAKKDFNTKKDTIIKIKKVKTNYLLKAEVLSNFTKDLNLYGVNVESIGYADKNKEFVFNLVSSRSSKITKLLKHLTKVYENNFRFTLEKIYYDNDSKVYFSKLKARKI